MNETAMQLELWDKAYNWHPFTPMASYLESQPIIITKAHGFFLVDQFGNEYIDGFSSLWCNLHGHQVPELDNALKQQLQLLIAHFWAFLTSQQPYSPKG